MRKKAQSLCCAWGVAFGLLIVFWSSLQAAQAQSASTTAPQVAKNGGLQIETVVVTAEKREQLLRDIPSTVNVVTGDQIAAAGPINGTGDLLATVPGVRFNDLSAPVLSEVSIRGSGTERATGADPAVGLFANGVYTGADGRNFNLIDSFDLDRAEVLSGPQGALYGRNAEYGLVNLISKLPTFEDTGYLDTDYTFQTENSRETAVVNHAFSDELAVRLGAELIQQRKGFVYNPDSDSYFDTTEGWMARGQIRYAHNRLDVDLLVQGQRMTVPVQWSGYDVSPQYPIANFPLGFTQPHYVLAQNGININKVNSNDVVLLVNYDFGWAKLTSTASYRDQDVINDNGGNFDLATSAILQQQELNAVTAGILTVKQAKSPYPIGQILSDTTNHDVYEDLHLSGAAINDRLNWVAGADFLYNRGITVASQQANPCSTTANNQPSETGTAKAPGPFSGICGGTPTNPVCYSFFQTYASGSGYTACPSPYPAIPGANPTISNWGYAANTKGQYYSWAPYASLSFDAGAGFTLAGDIRYTHDHKTAIQDAEQLYYPGTDYYFTAGGQIGHKNYSYDHSNLSFTTSLSYKIPGFWLIPSSWNDLLYLKFGSGYRAGGFNFGNDPPTKPCSKPPASGPNLCFYDNAQVPVTGTSSAYAPVIPQYGAETTQSYEIGFKGNITDDVFVTLDGYHSITWNALTAVGDGCTANNSCLQGNTNYTVNGGTVHASGIELALDTAFEVLNGQMNLEATGSEQTASYVHVPTLASAGATIAGLPIVGSQVAQTPHYLASLTVNYRHSITANISGFVNVVYHGQWGGVQDTVIYPPYSGVPSEIRLANIQDIKLRVGIDYDSFEIALVVDNLTNQTYKLAQYTQAAANPGQAGYLTYNTDRWSLPRTVAVQMSYRW